MLQAFHRIYTNTRIQASREKGRWGVGQRREKWRAGRSGAFSTANQRLCDTRINLIMRDHLIISVPRLQFESLLGARYRSGQFVVAAPCFSGSKLHCDPGVSVINEGHIVGIDL
jgi:hypothetical protein